MKCKSRLIKYICSVFFVFFSGGGLAEPYTINITLPDSKLPLAASDSLASGQSTSLSTRGINTRICENFGPYYQSTARTTLPYTGITSYYDGNTYKVYDIGIPGLGITIGAKDPNGYFIPVTNEEVKIYPSPGTSNDDNLSILGMEGMVRFVKTGGHVKSGIWSVPKKLISTVACYAKDNKSWASYINLSVPSLAINTSGCEVQSGATKTVNMGNIKMSDFTAIGSLSSGKSVNVNLRCDSNVKLYATVSDQSNMSNRTNTVTLSSDSTAKGLGVQVFYNNSVSPIILGPDDSSKGATNQFSLFKTTTAADEMVTLPFSFKYIRTGALSAGTANALVGITLSYQ